MISHQKILEEIQTITTKLIQMSLSERQNFPSCVSIGKDSYEIAYSGMQDLSIALKNIEYKQIYQELDKGKNYNFKMVDGALIQLLYTYNRSELVSHRLAFLPSPFLEDFQNNPEIYETEEIYADIIARNILPVPIRFDYDPDNHQELDHPKCHLTLGQFENCRIPVCSPISPNTFISFILRSFYNTAFRKFTSDYTFSSNLFNETITLKEKKVLHIAIYE
ncbi:MULTISPECIES: DUF2290 domain-containing protein [unclassified Dolichospermum]|uniref:DUF2290 domain-containing protein n=1 Tax=unclassified Dolichospermum TaxID=2622029 RepID=UPI0014486B60|nr:MULTISPECIES: DUF2290 domain-containing protein [unclassified Dolichospermum]MTJ18200.1 DUF2290 domain-containing protein [Dolichospermum sp. UHCC 0299]MTJ38952.1 DUF2290 domain-containing protein [Dolichospermum sp. UHCC 0406]